MFDALQTDRLFGERERERRGGGGGKRSQRTREKRCKHWNKPRYGGSCCFYKIHSPGHSDSVSRSELDPNRLCIGWSKFYTNKPVETVKNTIKPNSSRYKLDLHISVNGCILSNFLSFCRYFVGTYSEMAFFHTLWRNSSDRRISLFENWKLLK